MARQQDRIGLIRQEQFLLPFSQTHHMDFIHQVMFFQHLHCPAQLTLAAVHDDQIRQHGKGFVCLSAGFRVLFFGCFPAFDAAGQDFRHAVIIIRPVHGFDVKPAVMFLCRDALQKNDHGTHRIGPLRVGNIITFHAVRCLRQVKRVLDLRQCFVLLIGVVRPLDLERFQRLNGIFRRHIDQIFG